MPYIKVVGRNSCSFEAFFAGARFPCKMLHEQLWKVLSFTGEVSTTVNLERREHADVRLLITTHADNKHLFDWKATNKDAFEKIAEQFTKASAFLVKRRRGACKRMGLVTNGTLSSPTEILRIPNRKFPKFFVNGKRPNLFCSLTRLNLQNEDPIHFASVDNERVSTRQRLYWLISRQLTTNKTFKRGSSFRASWQRTKH